MTVTSRVILIPLVCTLTDLHCGQLVCGISGKRIGLAASNGQIYTLARLNGPLAFANRNKSAEEIVC